MLRCPQNRVNSNCEARRIVDSLCNPGQSAEDLLEVITCRFADGREIALDRLPLASALSSAETVRAEEIVLATPDGRSITTLVNATPIHAEDGAVASVVVTMQDLAPLEELEHMRAGFLGMVSHELRHSFASRALALGEGLPMIGKLLGHRKVQTTARYAHLRRESVQASTAKVAESIGADILRQ